MSVCSTLTETGFGCLFCRTPRSSTYHLLTFIAVANTSMSSGKKCWCRRRVEQHGRCQLHFTTSFHFFFFCHSRGKTFVECNRLSGLVLGKSVQLLCQGWTNVYLPARHPSTVVEADAIWKQIISLQRLKKKVKFELYVLVWNSLQLNSTTSSVFSSKKALKVSSKNAEKTELKKLNSTKMAARTVLPGHQAASHIVYCVTIYEHLP